MNKIEFLNKLRKGLSVLPQNDAQERLTFYREMIDDRIEEGLSEEDAVSEVGNVDEIITQILEEGSAPKALKPKAKLKVWEIVLLILGAPIWISLLIALFAVVISIYIVFWAIIICLWAVFAAVAGCALGGIVGGIGFVFGDNTFSGIAMLSAGLVCAGLSIFLFFGCKATTKGLILLTQKITLCIKSRFFKKEEVQ